MSASWRTTTLGVIAVVTTVLSAVKSAMTSGIGSVNFEAAIAAISAGWGLIHARDNSVSSEQAGIK